MILWLLTMWVCLAGPVSEGAEVMDEGRLDDAIALWEPVADGGSGVLLYNLGLAWHLKGDAGRALAYWRTAGELRPRDGNIHHNLAVARSELEGAVPPPVPPAMGWMGILSVTELGLVGLLLTGLGSGGALLWRRRRSASMGAMVLVLFAGGLSAGGLATAGWRARNPVVVVVADSAVARDAADVRAGVRFSFPLGSELSELQASGAFVLVEDGEGRRGWVPRTAVFHAGG